MKWLAIIIAIVALLSLIDYHTKEETEDTNDPIEAYFCPLQDCMAPMISAFMNASSYIHCAFYEINSNQIINSLALMSHKVDVKLITDESEVKGARIAPKFKTMHNKFCIIDGNTTITGSLNPTNSSFEKNNNNLIIIKSKRVAKNYEAEFQEMWKGVFGGGAKTSGPIIKLSNITIETYFCPEDNCQARVISQIKGAKKSINFMTFSFTSRDIANALLKANAPYRGIIEKSQNSRFSQADKLENVKLDANKYLMHHKVFIIDDEVVITGSYNPTQNGNENNDENLIIIRDKATATLYEKEFERLWKQ